VAEADRHYILDVLNYNMTDIFLSLGINTNGGKFQYVEAKDTDPATKMQIISQLNSLGLPIDDEYLYQEFGIPKPADYDALKLKKELLQQQALNALNNQQSGGDNKHLAPEPPSASEDNNHNPQAALLQRIRDFFPKAPIKQ